MPWTAGHRSAVEYTREYLSLANSKRFEDAHAVLRDKMFPILGETEKAAELLAQREREAMGASDREAQSKISSGRWAVFIVIGFSLLVAAAVLWVVFRITSTLRQVAIEMGDVRRGGRGRGVAGVLFQPVAGAGLLRAGGVARRDLRFERRDQLHGAQEHARTPARRPAW